MQITYICILLLFCYADTYIWFHIIFKIQILFLGDHPIVITMFLGIDQAHVLLSIDRFLRRMYTFFKQYPLNIYSIVICVVRL